MEVQAQSLIATVTSGSAAGGASGQAGNTAASNTQGQGAFATTLNGMMTGTQALDGTADKASLSGFPGLIQLLSPLIIASPAAGEQAANLTAEQVGVLTELLQQPDQADQMASNPDLQAWLLQLQSFIAVMMQNQQASDGTGQSDQTVSSEGVAEGIGTVNNQLLFVPLIDSLTANAATDTQLQAEVDMDAASGQEAQAAEGDSVPESMSNLLNPLLFVPIITGNQEGLTSEGDAQDANKPAGITSQQAVQLLSQLRDLMKDGQNDPKLKQLLNELPAVLVSAAAAPNMAQVHKPSATAAHMLHTVAQVKASSDNSTASLTDLVQIVSNKSQQLEKLASKNVSFMNQVEMHSDHDEPLFQPLIGNDAAETNVQPITVQEFMKQVQTSHPAKMPVLQMPAATFSDDMTQFVVSSFVMGTTDNGFTEAKISLYPQHLGHVEVKLTMHNGQLVAQFVADSLAGKEMLESQLSQLRTTLQNQGIQVEKLEVSQSQGFQSGMFQDGRQQQQSGQSAKQQKSASGRIAALDESAAEETTDAAATFQTPGNGSIDITA